MSEPADSWEQFCAEVAELVRRLQASKAVNVNSEELRGRAQHLVQAYFRATRAGLLALGIEDTRLATIDSGMQSVLTLSHGRNAKRSYLLALGRIKSAIPGVAAKRELLIGKKRDSASGFETQLEGEIHRTLAAMVPSAALSYEQAARDLQDLSRVSMRGTAAELREVLREAVDQLAPDDAVRSSAGRSSTDSKVTMKEKVRFILRSRGMRSGARDAAERAVSIIDEQLGLLARSIYDRGSLSTHVASSRGEVKQLKLYIDSLLADLLAINT